jgi:glycerol-3-phosphate acyltransferase PlsY
MDTFAALVAIIIAYLVGSIPVAQLAARYTKDVDLRDVGSGNVGASNIWQSVSRWMTVPVGLAQIAQGLVAVLVARLLGAGEGVQALCGIAAVIANDWNPWLGFTGGRGIGQTIGAMLGLSWQSLGVFTLVSLAGVVTGWIPQFVIIALFAAPYGAVVAGQSAATAWGCLAFAIIAAIKRVLGNERPSREHAVPDVYLNRLVYDRDVRERDAWVRRNLSLADLQRR